jgi:2-(1,2-epoxy-1,2-dihydrophenyl)acetyl-CoA isomerase
MTRTSDPVGSEDLVVLFSDGVLVLTLNRPAARNAFTRAMLDQLGDALEHARDADEVKAVVLTGAGPGFSAGGDVKLFARGESIFGRLDDPARVERHARAQRRTVVQLWNFPKPTIALVNGAAVGAGLALALACDLRYAADSAILRTGFLNAGLAGDFGCSWLLTHLAGRSRAAELMLASSTISAAHAKALGLVNDVLEPNELVEAGMARARQIASAPAAAVRAIKDNLARTQIADLGAATDVEAQWHDRLVRTPEHRAAVDALLRRPPSRRPPDD